MNAKALAVTHADPGHRPPDPGTTLLQAHLRGDPRAFTELVRSYGPRVLGYLRHAGLAPAVAEELLQETFLRVHAAAPRFDLQRALRPWILAIASNLLRSHWRRQRIRSALLGWWRRGSDREPDAGPETFDLPSPLAGPDELLLGRERVAVVAAAMARLPQRQRQALLLTRLEGLELQEAAEVLDVPLGTIKTWVRRGRLAMADALARHDAAGGER